MGIVGFIECATAMMRRPAGLVEALSIEVLVAGRARG
jgi:hypothetical protein